MRTLLAWLALLVVSWQAVLSTLDVSGELTQRPISQHLRALRATPEELIDSKLGPDSEIRRALRAKIPAGTKVLVSFANVRSEYQELRRRITWLGALVYPIVLQGWPYDPSRTSTPGKTQRREYVLDLASGRDFSAWPIEELARGPRFRLMIVGSEPR